MPVQDTRDFVTPERACPVFQQAANGGGVSSSGAIMVFRWHPALRFPLLICLIYLADNPVSQADASRPNILWISCEDISPHLGCYGDPLATTPNLDQLAADGIRFTQAFSCHGVCAPSRTGIITGMYPISLGANHMRSKVQLPSHVRLFPQYLREAGYYCTNNSKTDYNLVWDQRATWNESSGRAHWKNRPDKSMPFFAVFNLTMTHESKVWPTGWKEVVETLPPDQRHSSDRVTVPNLYPDTPAIREDLARIADLITVMDQEAGRLLAELEAAGLAEDTIVVFWSDHGNGLPRFKRWTYDSGAHVPLIVRVPQKFREMAGSGAPGSVDDRLISLIDLGPTVLSLAGIAPLEHFHGRPFLGPHRRADRDYIYGARDRLDERFDLVRTVRNRQFQYVRNLMPWRPALQNVAYGEQNETLKEMRRLLAEGMLPSESAQWFQSPRPAEELYDLNSDPWEVTNLAGRPEFQTVLAALRAECDRWQFEVRDQHLLPEILQDESERSLGSRWQTFQGPDGAQRLRDLLTAACITARLDPKDAQQLPEQLSPDPAIRWWQLTLLARCSRAQDFADRFRACAADESPVNRIAAAAGLARAGASREAADRLRELLHSDNPFVRHAAMLEADEAGAPVLQQLRNVLETTAGVEEEYFQRLRKHALNQVQN